jgi:hypothetical protein
MEVIVLSNLLIIRLRLSAVPKMPRWMFFGGKSFKSRAYTS